MSQFTRICCAGEVMIEFSPTRLPGIYRQSLAGDSYNTAVYLARAGLDVEYLTCLGKDAQSDLILEALGRENIAYTRIQRLESKQPGLYLIENDSNGERSFSYWRDTSAARELFKQPVELQHISHFYFTGITLAVCRQQCSQLVALLTQLKQSGCRVIFDSNYRPALWKSQAQAREFYAEILPYCDCILSTLEDETALWNVSDIEQCKALYQHCPADELVIKTPDLVTHARCGEEQQRVCAKAVDAIDTTGAGDAFNAGYLAARIHGKPLEQAVQAGQKLAARVVLTPGAIMPRTQTSG